MQWTTIFAKGEKIMNVGVSLAACGPDRAIAFEETESYASAKAHQELCKTSVHYPVYDDIEAVEGCTVGCGHLNQFLACIECGTPVPEKHQASLCEPGRPFLDKDRLCRDQPALQHLMTNGLRFTKIKRSVEKEFTALPHIFQKALNVEHHIGEGDLLR